MRFEIVGKNIAVTPAMRTKIEEKLSALDKYLLIDENTIARVLARVYPNSQKVEVTIPSRVGILRAEVVNNDFYAAVDLAHLLIQILWKKKIQFLLRQRR